MYIVNIGPPSFSHKTMVGARGSVLRLSMQVLFKSKRADKRKFFMQERRNIATLSRTAVLGSRFCPKKRSRKNSLMDNKPSDFVVERMTCRSYLPYLNYKQTFTEGETSEPTPKISKILKKLPYSPGRGSEFEHQIHLGNNYDPPLSFAGLPMLHRASLFAIEDRVFIRDFNGHEFTYMHALLISSELHDYFIKNCSIEIQNERVLVLSRPHNIAYVTSIFAAWSTGSIAVPVGLYPEVAFCEKDIRFILDDTDPLIIIYDDEVLKEPSSSFLFEVIEKMGMTNRLVRFEDAIPDATSVCNLPDEELTFDFDFNLGQDGFVKSIDSPGVILYTHDNDKSGSSLDSMKGVVLSHRVLNYQLIDICKGWNWRETDRLLSFSPSTPMCPDWKDVFATMWAGGSCEFMPLEPIEIWNRIKDPNKSQITILKGPPSYYKLLLDASYSFSQEEWKQIIKALESIKLCISTESAIPEALGRLWKQRTGGHVIVGTFDVLECGLILSDSFNNKLERRFGYEGLPAQSVDLRLIDPITDEQLPWESQPGELRVKGIVIFSKYWNNREYSRHVFDENGYYKTGITVTYDERVKKFKVLGRPKPQIIDHNKQIFSALDVEKILWRHPDILEVHVASFQAPDGIRFGAACRVKKIQGNDNEGEENEDNHRKDKLDDYHHQKVVNSTSIIEWCKLQMPSRCVPAKVLVTSDEIPRTTFGKVDTKRLQNHFLRPSST